MRRHKLAMTQTFCVVCFFGGIFLHDIDNILDLYDLYDPKWARFKLSPLIESDTSQSETRYSQSDRKPSEAVKQDEKYL